MGFHYRWRGDAEDREVAAESVSDFFHAGTLSVFLLYLAPHTVNNEPFMTSVLPLILEKAQRRHSGVCIQLIGLY